MIIPIIAAAAALLLVLGHHASSAGGPGQLASERARHFSQTTLVAVPVLNGVYETKVIPNTTSALTHMLNARAQGQAVYITPDNRFVQFATVADREQMVLAGYILYLAPGGVIHR